MKTHARFMAAVSCSDVPKVSIITGAFHGIDSYAMVSIVLYIKTNLLPQFNRIPTVYIICIYAGYMGVH